MQLSNTNVTIVGLGLMGGSLALALRGKCARLIGVDADENTRRDAVEREVVEFASGDFLEGVAAAELVVLATPVKTILAQIEQLAAAGRSNSPLCLLDLGSTKAQICAAMAALPDHIGPIGGHPMCGKEKSGLSYADGSLYTNATFVLTPLRNTTPVARKLAEEIVNACGARPLILDPERHDALVAVTSHLPYLLSCSLLAAAQEQADADAQGLIWSLTATGFRDTTRLAGSDVRVMADILRTNPGHIAAALRRQRDRLDELAALLESGSDTALHETLHEIRAARLARVKPPAATRVYGY